MTQTLAVGDKVKTYAGSGVVTYVHAKSPHVEVKIEGRDYGRACAPNSPGQGAGTFHVNNVAKVEPEPAFKVGDRVRFTGKDHHVPKGIGTVSKVETPDYGEVVYVTWPSKVLPISGMAYEFEKAEQVFRLKAGDRIRNIRTGREGRVEETGLHGALRVFDLKPPFKDPVPVVAVEEYEEHHPNTYELLASEPW